MKSILLIIFIAFFTIGSVGKITANVEDAEVYVVFFSVSPDLSNEVLYNLNKKTEGVKFSGGEIISYDGEEGFKTNNLILQEIEILKGENLDGLILFCGGFCDANYLQTELPTLIVDCSPFGGEELGYRQPLYRGFQIGFNNAVTLAEKFEAKFITAKYPVNQPESLTDLELSNLVEKVNLFKVIKDLKNSKIISIQDHKGLNRIDQGTYDGLITHYDLTYTDKLKEYFGIELIIVDSEEISQEMLKVDKKEAEKIADIWIKEATEVKHVEKNDIVRSAMFCLVNKALVKKYKAHAITFDSATLSGILQQVYPLIIMELSKNNIPSACQSHIDCMVTSLIGRYMTGYAGFTGDILNDWIFMPTGDRPENVIIVGHCGAPIRVKGYDRVPYLITDHYIGLHHQRAKEGNIPVAITVDFPHNEDSSIGKVDVYRKKISILTAKVIDANFLYEDWPTTSCRNKIAIELDRPEDCYMLPTNPNAGAFRQNDTWDLEYRHFGSHHVVFYGNLRKKFKDLGALIGFDVISN